MPWYLLGSAVFAFTLLAADKNGVSPNSISLPKGPGSIEGLGESFQPSLNTGTAKHELGLKLPLGTAGHQPQLSLSYEGGGGNGPLGYGWGLSLPFIQRRTDKGMPTYGEFLGVHRPDTFISEAREELVPLTNAFLFCENEGGFVRYRQLTSHWEGTAPNGTLFEFGLTANGRIQDASGSRVFSWLLERQTDTRGNVIEYLYRDLAPSGNQKYLALIRYGPGAPPWSHYHFVAFEYEDRPDSFEDCRSGFVVRTTKRLKRIHVGTQGIALSNHLAGDFDGDGLTDYLNRRYELGYLNYAGAESHWSLLSEVTLVGADGLTALPPAKFNYAVSNPTDIIDASTNVWSGVNEPAFAMDNDLVELADLNADGLPDVLKTESSGGAHTAWLNRGPVQLAGTPALQWAPPVDVNPGNGTAWNFDLASDRTHLADMDGDGLADLVHKGADDAVFYFANGGNLTWSTRRDMVADGIAPPAPFGNPSVRTADIDFDKRIDIIESIDVGGGVAYRVWLNLSNQAYSAPFSVEPEAGFDFSLPGVQIADCNGDRVPDVARIRAGAVNVAAGLGYGRLALITAMPLPDITLDDLQISKAKLTDLNGDGLADLVLERAAPGQCWYWLNLGNYTFNQRKILTGLPLVTSAASVRWADLNGNGTTDLIYSDSAASPRIQMIDIGMLVNGGLAPNLLTRIENGIGRVTSIIYKPSTHFALADTAAGNPWPDPVPFPVTVVAEVRTSDSLGHEYMTKFRYHNGYYDPVEKQFRGFENVEQIDVGDSTAPTLVSRSEFDTGREYDALKGRLLVATAETEAGEIFSREITQWSNPPRTLHTGTNGLPVRYAHPVSKVREILELGVGTPRRLESDFQFDDYGNQTRTSDFGIVEDGNRNAFDDERVTITEYALNLEKWIIRLPKRQIVQDENGEMISKSESFYDDETFSGNNFGVVTIGNLTLQRSWIDPANPVNFISSARTKYDRFGNPIAVFDPLSSGNGGLGEGHYREMIYDHAFQAFPIREIIHIGNGSSPLIFQAAYDEGLATVRGSIDFNTNTTFYNHDSFGRLTSIVQPGDTVAFPTTEYSYLLRVPAGSNQLINFVETRQLDREPGTRQAKRDHYFISRAFLDGLGRPIMTRTEAEPGEGSASPRVAVSAAVIYNARQKPARALTPFFTTATGSLDELLAFENVEAQGWTGQFHEAGSLVTLDLALAHQLATDYDANLRDIRTTNPDGSFTRNEYEPLLIRSFDENDVNSASPHFGTPMVKFNDGLGRLIRTDEIVRLNDDGTASNTAQAWTTLYSYDLNDCHIESIDPQGNVKQMHYDGLKRKISINDPDAGITTNVYDHASNLIDTVDAKGQRITYTFDGANRILSEDYHDDSSPEFRYSRTPDVRFHYDAPSDSVPQGDGTSATARNVNGMLAWVEDCAGEEHTSYDRRGRVEWTVKRLPDPVTSLSAVREKLISYRTGFDYDSMNRVVRMVYPDNDQITCDYNARSLLNQIVGGPNGLIISNVVFAPSAQQLHVTHGNGVRTTSDYDSRSRLVRLQTMHAGLATEFIHFAYDFDGASALRAIHDLRSPAALSLEDPRRNSQSFRYDELYRLSRSRFNEPNPATLNGGEITYRYDRIGNMLEQSSDIAEVRNGIPAVDLGAMSYGDSRGRSNRIGRQPGDPPGPHALTSIHRPSTNSAPPRLFSYDANGNMQTLDGLSCTWDFRNRLVSIEDKFMRAEYRYDYKGERAFKKVIWQDGAPAMGGYANPSRSNVTTTTYIGKHFEVRDHDQPIKYVFNGAVRIAKVTGSLSSNLRIQRLRVHVGWNLVSVAVSVDSSALTTTMDAAYLCNSLTAGYSALAAGQTITAGSVLWLKSSTNGMLALMGEYVEPAPRSLPAGTGFIPAPGLEAWTLHLPDSVGAAHYDNQEHRWSQAFPGELDFISELPPIISPGEAIFVSSDTPALIDIPSPALRIVYYHQDHLGSSSVLTAADGALIRETAFYPFGTIRNEYRAISHVEPFQFTQKERDQESGLDYFGVRYYAAGLNRWLSCDPAGAIDGLNPYLYVKNSPMRFVDREGYEKVDPNVWRKTARFFSIDPGDGFAWENFKDPDVAFQAAIEAHKVNNYRGNGKTAEDHVASFFAGIGDMLVGWALDTKKIREQYLNVKIVDEDSGAYTAGGILGIAGGMAAPKMAGPGKTTANASFGDVRVGNPRTSQGVVQGGGGVYARTALSAELANTIPDGTMVTGAPSPATRAGAQQVMKEMYADPYWGPRLRKADATRAERMRVEQTDRPKAIQMLEDTFNLK